MLVQRAALGQSRGTTVQLPSYRNFSYSGSFLVPDYGGAYMGGNSRGVNQGSRNRSLLPNISRNSLQSTFDAQVRVFVIDHDQWDRMILGGSPQEFLRRQRTLQAQQSTGRSQWDPETRATVAAVADPNATNHSETSDPNWTAPGLTC